MASDQMIDWSAKQKQHRTNMEGIKCNLQPNTTEQMMFYVKLFSNLLNKTIPNILFGFPKSRW